jgi:mannose-6-phosphate isomerase-like protein (cupin superfamily)
MMRRCVGALAVVGVSLLVACSTNSTSSNATVTTLAQGPVMKLPAGKIFANVLEFRQVPGSDFGPHAHIPALIYTLHGVSTLSSPGAASRSVGPGQAAFIPALVMHTHQNLDGRIGAGAIAVGLIVVVVLLCAATWLRGRGRGIVIAALAIFLIAEGTLPLVGATSNDYYLIAVRPEAQRALPMPRPDGLVVFSSPDLDQVPAAPYSERLIAISVPPGARYNATDAAGPQMLIIVEGSATVHVGGQTLQLATGEGAFAQRGTALSITNPGSDPLRVIGFTITSAARAT